MSINEDLIFLTNHYPYGSGEEFIENEIGFLSSHFNKIYIVPLVKDNFCRKIPDNVVILENPTSQHLKSNKYYLKQPFKFLKVLGQLMLNFRPYKPYLTKRRNVISYTQQLFALNDSWNLFYQKNQIDTKSTPIYSFWFDNRIMQISLINLLNANRKIIVRAHEADLYEEINDQNGFFLYRQLALKWLNKVILISYQGKEYLKTKYPTFQHKFYLSRLGTLDHGLNSISSSKRLKIVSCSYINERKRIHLIIDLLKHFRSDVDWVHIGDGEEALKMELINKAKRELPLNVSYSFLGKFSNQEVLNYYKENSVDAFILLSRSEGLPVSLMEVASFGIPLIATNVGGVNEIVNEKTGLLLDKDFNPELDAKKVEDFITTSILKAVDFRQEIKQFWKTNYFAETNYTNFIELIKN